MRIPILTGRNGENSFTMLQTAAKAAPMTLLSSSPFPLPPASRLKIAKTPIPSPLSTILVLRALTALLKDRTH